MVPRTLFFPAALLLASFTAGCAADSDEPVASGSDAVEAAGGTSRSSLRCTIEGFVADAPTALPQTAGTAEFVKARVADANARAAEAEQNGEDARRYRISDFGPYQKLRFTVKVEGGSGDVDARITFFHTLPGGKRLPAQTAFAGKLPAEFSQEITTELYYDAEKHGLGPDAPRFGRNEGKIVFSCGERGATSRDEQEYSFERVAR